MRKDYFYFGIFVFVIGFLIAGYSANLYNGSVFSGLPYGLPIMVLGVCVIVFSLLTKRNPKTTAATENQVLKER